MKRNVLSSPRLSELKKRRRRVFFNKALVYFVIFFVVLTLAAFLSRLSGLNIATIQTEGNIIVDTESIRAVAERETSGKYLWLFPKTNILFYPKSKIKDALGAEYPRLGQIDLSVKNDRVLSVSVTEREPLYTWCGETMPTTGEEQECYFLDKEGYIFDEAPYFSGDVYFKFYGALGVTPLYPKNSYFAKEYFAGLVMMKDAVSAMDLKLAAFYLKDDGDAELYLTAGKAQPKILIRADTDMNVLAQNLEVALDTEPLKTRFQKELSKLEYLDLRFDNKVYSKFSTPEVKN
ncbi:MAG: hypothetical protein M3M85_03730 [bacterium]|nr:hypothetical protein [bacterium]